MENKIAVIGIGPGSRDYITNIALEKIKEAEVVVGGKRHLKEFSLPHHETYPIDKDLKGALEYIKKQSETKKVAVLVSGDTGIFSFSSYLAKNFPEEKLEFYPGISSLQLLFARVKMSWQDASFITFHGEPTPGIEKIVINSKKTAMVTSTKYNPQKIAQFLIEKGVDSNLKAVVGVNLSYEDEKIYWTTLSELQNMKEDMTNSVVIIYHE